MLVYYAVLATTHVPAEVHLYARGVHVFSLHPVQIPITDWLSLADIWLRTVGMTHH